MTYSRSRRTGRYPELLALLSFLLVCAFGCHRDPDGSPAPEARPTVVGGVACMNPHYYAGLVREGSKVSHDFELINRSEVARSIASIEKSCSCFDATPSRRTLNPGESCDISVTLDMGSSNNIASTSAQVYFEGIDEPLTLEVGARVRPYLRVAPGSLDFNRLGIAEHRTRVLKVAQTSAAAPLLDHVESEVEGLEIETERLTDTPPHVWEVRVSLSGDHVTGNLNGSLLLVRSDGESVPIPLRAEAAWGFEVFPPRPVLVLQPHSATAHISVRSRDGLPFLITSVRCSPPFLEAKATLGSEPSDLHQITLGAIAPNGQDGVGEGTIELTIQKLGDHEPVVSDLQIPISYFGASASSNGERADVGGS